MDDFIVKEYAIKDKDGNFKIWQKGRLINYQQWLASKAVETSKNKLQKSNGITAIVDTGMEEPVLAPPAPVIVKQVPKFSLEKIVNKLLNKFSLTLNNEAKDRLSRLLLSFFRGVRTVVDLRISLRGDWQSGDVDLKKDVDIDSLLQVIKEIDKKIKASGGEVVSLQIDEKKLKATPHIANEIDKAKKEAKDEIKQTIDKQAAILQQAKISASGNIANLGKEPVSEGGFVVKKQEPKPEKRFLTWRKRSHNIPAGKVAMDDVKGFVKLVGPIDELQRLDLNVFKRLGSDANAIVDRIKDRIDFLSTGSISKRSRVIQAWQASPIYSLYVKLGRASLEEGLPVDTVIKQQMNAGQSSLTVEEFDAISDLNAKFRF